VVFPISVLDSVLIEQPQIEILTADEFAARLKVLTSWVREMSKRSRTSDPIPTMKLGKHNRYVWGSKQMIAWLNRRFA
jgi:hypothetical protein